MFNEIPPIANIIKIVLEDLPFILKDTASHKDIETHSLMSYLDDEVENFILSVNRSIKIKQLTDNIKYEDLNIFEKDVLQYANYLNTKPNKKDNMLNMYYVEKKINWNIISYDIPPYIPNEYTNNMLAEHIISFFKKEIINFFITDIKIYSSINKDYNKNVYNKSDTSAMLNLLKDVHTKDNKYVIVPCKIQAEYYDTIDTIRKYTRCPIYYIDCNVDNIIICNYKPTLYYMIVQNVDCDFRIRNHIKIGITYPSIMPFLDFILF